MMNTLPMIGLKKGIEKQVINEYNTSKVEGFIDGDGDMFIYDNCRDTFVCRYGSGEVLMSCDTIKMLTKSRVQKRTERSLIMINELIEASNED